MMFVGSSSEGRGAAMQDETAGELFDTTPQNIQQRIMAVLSDGEQAESTINSELIVRQEGSRQVRREIQTYNLDMILSVGYRVRSQRGVQFRQWATTVLREYLV